MIRPGDMVIAAMPEGTVRMRALPAPPGMCKLQLLREPDRVLVAQVGDVVKHEWVSVIGADLRVAA